jgi:hypothetical protein
MRCMMPYWLHSGLTALLFSLRATSRIRNTLLPGLGIWNVGVEERGQAAEVLAMLPKVRLVW